MRLKNFLLYAVYLILFHSGSVFAQFYVKNCRVTVRENDTLNVLGSLVVDPNGRIHNDGTILISDSLVNHSMNLFLSSSNPALAINSNVDPMGDVVFKGTKVQTIKGDSSIFFNDIHLLNNILLKSSIKLFGTINLLGHTLSLQNNSVWLFDKTPSINRVSGRLYDTYEEYKIESGINGYMRTTFDFFKGINEYAGGIHLGLRFDNNVSDVFISANYTAVPTLIDGSVRKNYLVTLPSDMLNIPVDLSMNVMWHEIPTDFNLHDPCYFVRSHISNTIKRLSRPTISGAKGVVFSSQMNHFINGVYTIAENNCSIPPVVGVTGNSSICKGDVAELLVMVSNALGEVMYNWSSNSKSIDVSDMEGGVQFLNTNIAMEDSIDLYLHVTDERLCYGVDTFSLVIHPIPTVKPYMTDSDGTKRNNYCVNEMVLFNDSITQNGISRWQFGDGSSSIGLQVNKKYKIPKYYTNIKYSTTSIYGCTNKQTLNAFIAPLPHPLFISDTEICEGDTSFFLNQSSMYYPGFDVAISKYIWDFGNGDSLISAFDSVSSYVHSYAETFPLSSEYTIPSARYLFPDTGSFYLKLTAVSNFNCIADTTVAFNVNSQIKAGFIVGENTNVCFGENSLFVLPNDIVNQEITQVTWRFYDGKMQKIDKMDSLEYAFNLDGTYYVQQIIQSVHSCVDSVLQAVVIYPLPVASFSVNIVCQGQVSIFRNNSSMNEEDTFVLHIEDEYLKAFNGSDIFLYSFKSANDFVVELEATNKHYCKAFDTLISVVHPLPDIDVIITNMCFSESLIKKPIINNSFYNYGDSFTWIDNKGDSIISFDPNYTFDKAGTYDIRILAGNEYECIKTVNEVLILHPDPVSDFNIEDGVASVCVGNTSIFSLSSSCTRIDVQQYEWYISNRELVITYPDNPSLNYTFEQSGSYNLELRVLTSKGCYTDVRKDISIYSLPDPVFNVTDVCEKETAFFEASDYFDLPVVKRMWEMADGKRFGFDSLAPLKINYLYNQAGIYSVILTETNDKGCTKSFTKEINVFPLPSEPLDDIAATCGDSLILYASNDGFKYLWSTSETTLNITVKNSGGYFLSVYDPQTNCKIKDSVLVQLHDQVYPQLGNDTTVCGSILLDAHNPEATYLWSDGFTERKRNVNVSGTFTVVVTDINNCIGFDSISFVVNPVPNSSVLSYYSACAGDTLTIISGAAYTDSVKWSDANSFNELNVIVSSDIRKSLTKMYWLELQNLYGCKSHNNFWVTMNPRPNKINDTIESCKNSTIWIDAGTSACSYVWSDSNSNQVRKADISNDYFVTVTNSHACSVQNYFSVIYNELPTVLIPNSINACIGDTIDVFCGNGMSAYAWNNGATSQTISILHSGSYKVTVSDSNGCSAISNYSEIYFHELPRIALSDTISACNTFTLDGGADAIHWIWNTGLNNRFNNVDSSGIYSVAAENIYSCKAFDTSFVIIKKATKPNLGNDRFICEGERVLLSLPNINAQLIWDDGSINNSLWVINAGIRSVRAYYTNDCIVSDTIVIKSAKRPVFNWGSDMFLCSNESLVLNPKLKDCFYNWQGPDQENNISTSCVVKSVGLYSLTATNYFGCSWSDTIIISASPPLIQPMFLVASDIRVNDSLHFIDLSVPNPTSYLWEFGDGNFSSDSEPIHIYRTSSRYKAVQHVGNGYCISSLVKHIDVKGILKSMEPDTADGEINGNIRMIRILNTKVYPNPSDGLFTLSFNVSASANVQLLILDIQGQLFDNRLIGIANEAQVFYDLKAVKPGIYFIKIIAGSDTKTLRIVKI